LKEHSVLEAFWPWINGKCERGFTLPSTLIVMMSGGHGGALHTSSGRILIEKDYQHAHHVLNLYDVHDCIQLNPVNTTSHWTNVGWSCYRGGCVSEVENLGVNFPQKN
jgi:hypothetical protein